MPWNEPGGSDKDPWGKGKSDGGSKGTPADNIEDITRKMNEKLGGILGKKSSGKNAPSGSALILIGLALVAAWLATGFYTVDQAERGVEFRFGAFSETTNPGLHWHFPVPIESVELVDVDKVRKAEDRKHMLTSDENIVDIGVSAQYTIKNPEDYLFNVYLPDYERNQSIGTLFQVMRSAVIEIAGRNTLDSIIVENRESVATETQLVMQKVLDDYKSGLEVIKVNITDAGVPKQVQDAFDDAIRAREDQNRFKNQAETYANSVVPIAEGKASRLQEAATAYKSQIISQAEGDASRFNQLVAEYEQAPEVTRKRLYLETMESVYENTNKIMVDSKSGNNLLYLPLNQLKRSSGNSSAQQEFDPAAAGFIDQTIRNQSSGIRQSGRESRRGTR